MFTRNVALSLAAFAIAAGSAIAQTATTSTATANNEVGPVGVGSTETIQINVVNLASNPTVSNTSTVTPTPASCTGSISLNNTAGSPIGASTPFTVTAGQVFSVAFPFNKLSTTAARIEVVGVVSETVSSANRAPCSLHYSVETFDSTTGATHVFISGASATPALPFGRN